MTTLPQRSEIIALVSDAIESGARQDRACAAICLSERTLQRWQRDTAFISSTTRCTEKTF